MPINKNMIVNAAGNGLAARRRHGARVPGRPGRHAGWGAARRQHGAPWSPRAAAGATANASRDRTS